MNSSSKNPQFTPLCSSGYQHLIPSQYLQMMWLSAHWATHIHCGRVQEHVVGMTFY